MNATEVLAQAGIFGNFTTGIEPDGHGCLLWPRSKTSSGYGQLRRSGKVGYVHRLVYEAAIGPIPMGWHVDHVWARGCRARACFAPEHLEAVTPAENARRAGKIATGSMLFPCGHPRTADNTKSSGNCYECHRTTQRERGHRKYAPYRAALAERTVRIKELAAKGQSRAKIADEVGCAVETVRRTVLGLMVRY